MGGIEATVPDVSALRIRRHRPPSAAALACAHPDSRAKCQLLVCVPRSVRSAAARAPNHPTRRSMRSSRSCARSHLIRRTPRDSAIVRRDAPSARDPRRSLHFPDRLRSHVCLSTNAVTREAHVTGGDTQPEARGGKSLNLGDRDLDPPELEALRRPIQTMKHERPVHREIVDSPTDALQLRSPDAVTLPQFRSGAIQRARI